MQGMSGNSKLSFKKPAQRTSILVFFKASAWGNGENFRTLQICLVLPSAMCFVKHICSSIMCLMQAKFACLFANTSWQLLVFLKVRWHAAPCKCRRILLGPLQVEVCATISSATSGTESRSSKLCQALLLFVFKGAQRNRGTKKISELPWLTCRECMPLLWSGLLKWLLLQNPNCKKSSAQIKNIQIFMKSCNFQINIGKFHGSLDQSASANHNCLGESLISEMQKIKTHLKDLAGRRAPGNTFLCRKAYTGVHHFR